MIKEYLVIITMLLAISASAQAIVQPKIMVIPYTKQGEDLRTVLEEDPNKRIAFVKNKEFDAAIACLMTVPEELHDLYKKTYSKACEIYQAREKYIAARAARKRQDANNSILVKAQGQLSAHNPTEALKTLWEYSISNTSQDGEYRNLQLKAEAMISSAEQTIFRKEKQEYEDRKAKEEREYQDKRQEYNDNMRLKNRQIDITEKEIENRRANQNDITNAIKSIALAYIDKSKRI